MDPLISVVIPSRQRPALLMRAIRSVLLQKRHDVEVIIVLDGDTSGTRDYLREIAAENECIRILSNAARMGAPVARNQGVEAARGHWIAFLDDDDEWLPGKLDRQMELALASRYREPVISCRSIVLSSGTKKIWPEDAPFMPLGDYMFVRKAWRKEGGLLQTSTLVAPRSLLLRVPFSPELKRFQDVDWVLRASMEPTVGIEFLPDALSCWHVEEDGRERITDFQDWRYYLNWGRSIRSMLTPQAYAFFLLEKCMAAAGKRRDLRAMMSLYREAMRECCPGPRVILAGFRTWFVAAFRVRTLLRRGWSRLKTGVRKPRPVSEPQWTANFAGKAVEQGD